MESPLCPPDDPDFRLIETFRWEPRIGVIRRSRHLARLARSAARLGIEPNGVEALLDGLRGHAPLRVRLTLDRTGRAEVTTAPFTPLPQDTVWRVALAGERLVSTDPWLQIKSTRRACYDAARATLPADIDERLFLNERGEICEGTIANFFADLGQGLVTPPVNAGLLPGILREDLIETGQVEEVTLTPDSLTSARQLYVGNSLRGLIAVNFVGP